MPRPAGGQSSLKRMGGIARIGTVAMARNMVSGRRSYAGRRRGRRWRWLLVLALGILLVVLLPQVVLVRAQDGPHSVVRTLVVQPGDTLWAIARRQTGDTRDLREVIWRIRIANKLDNSRIVPGQMLLIPGDL